MRHTCQYISEPYLSLGSRENTALKKKSPMFSAWTKTTLHYLDATVIGAGIDVFFVPIHLHCIQSHREKTLNGNHPILRSKCGLSKYWGEMHCFKNEVIYATVEEDDVTSWRPCFLKSRGDCIKVCSVHLKRFSCIDSRARDIRCFTSQKTYRCSFSHVLIHGSRPSCPSTKHWETWRLSCIVKNRRNSKVHYNHTYDNCSWISRPT